MEVVGEAADGKTVVEVARTSSSWTSACRAPTGRLRLPPSETIRT
ncbi:hypothetical protein ACFXPY_32695 [Streptomyces sp. NPDC059153]